MPKQKTHSGSKKRFKVTGTGKVMRCHNYTGHLKRHKTQKQNRQLRGETFVSTSDLRRIRQMISNL